MESGDRAARARCAHASRTGVHDRTPGEHVPLPGRPRRGLRPTASPTPPPPPRFGNTPRARPVGSVRTPSRLPSPLPEAPRMTLPSRPRLLVAALLLVAAPALAEAPAAPKAASSVRAPAKATSPAPLTSVEGISEYRLDNGLRVLLFPDPTKPTVTVNLTYFVGSRHEGYGETGMAHLLEHLMFKGTPTTRNVPQALTQRGAPPNGTTSLDRTNYYETLPASCDNLP